MFHRPRICSPSSLHSAIAVAQGVIATARNLGQIAAFFLKQGSTTEAVDFYLQAKAMFDNLLGPNHPKTIQWMEDLFFLINA